MSESRRSPSKVPQILDKQAPGHSETRASRHERHERDVEAAHADTQGILAQADDATPHPASLTRMDVFNAQELKALLADTTRICVSLALPTRAAGGIPPVMTAFKNQMRAAEKQLITLGMDAEEARTLLIPVQELLEHPTFWQSTSEGLAVFRSPELFRVYRVPQALEETALVNDHFQIQPLLPLLNGDGHFYVLTLSQDDIRLLRGNHEQMREIHLEGVPRNMAEALNEEPERHAFMRNNAFGSGQQFHGHSQAKEDTNDRLSRFFHMIDKGLHKYFKDETAPLVLVGVEYLFPIYRGANTYKHLVEQGIHGNPDQLTLRDLHDHAWPIVQPFFLQAQEHAITRYNEAKALDNLTDTKLEDIISAATFGRVDTLFTAIGAKRYGLFDAEANTVVLHDGLEPGDEELTNFAAMQTLLHSGTVYALPPDAMPDGAQIAALYRF